LITNNYVGYYVPNVALELLVFFGETILVQLLSFFVSPDSYRDTCTAVQVSALHHTCCQWAGWLPSVAVAGKLGKRGLPFYAE